MQLPGAGVGGSPGGDCFKRGWIIGTVQRSSSYCL